MTTIQSSAPQRALMMLNKVPQITLIFWVIKVLSTTVGETAADFLSDRMGFGLGVTSIVMSVLFLIALAVQLTRNRYIPAVYWIVVVLVSVVGTVISHNLVDNLGISRQSTTIAFSIALAVLFFTWWRSEPNLSVHSTRTTKRALF